MSNRSKGNRAERKAELELQKDGWITYRVKGATKFIKNVDIFSLFDIVARKDRNIRWIQVKSNRQATIQPYKDYYYTYCSPNESVELWTWQDRKGWRKTLI